MPVVTFAVKDKEADVRAEKYTLTTFQTTVLVITPLGRLEVTITPPAPCCMQACMVSKWHSDLILRTLQIIDQLKSRIRVCTTLRFSLSLHLCITRTGRLMHDTESPISTAYGRAPAALCTHHLSSPTSVPSS